MTMKILKPKHYAAFQCIAAACEDSCCKEWEVVVDDDAATAYRALPGALGDRLREVLRQEDGCTYMTVTEGRCPMWRQDGLCEIQRQLGHDALCQTCRQFPRLEHDYGSFLELGLEMSCPEAARLLFAADAWEFSKESRPGCEEGDYESWCMEALLSSRETVRTFLNDISYSLPEKLEILLLYGYEVQNHLDGGDAPVFAPDICLADSKKYAAETGDIASVFSFFEGLEILTERWKNRLAQGAHCTASSDALLPFVRYCVERYWLQAVADYDLISRVKFIIIAWLLLNAMGGDTVSTAQLFSKEIENNPDNLNAILNAAFTGPAFTDANLLALLKC